MKWQMISIVRDNNRDTPSILNCVEAGCVLCSSGFVEIMVNGKTFMLDESKMFIYPPYAEIAVGIVSPELECIVLDVDHQFLLNTLKAVSWSGRLQLISDCPIAPLSEFRIERINLMLSLLKHDKNSENRLDALSDECLKQTLTYEVLAAFTEQIKIPAETKTSKDFIVMAFQAMLKRECTNHRSVAYYAAAMNLTPRYFTTVIREMTGNTASYWITKSVIVEAQHLMLDYSLSLKEITFRLNFSSQTFFSRWYRQYSGETPTQFRKRNKI